MKKLAVIWLILGVSAFMVTCQKDPSIDNMLINDDNSGPKPYFLKSPPGFPDYLLPEGMELTEEGIALGKKLFHDPVLSRNNNISCSSCHLQEFGFSDSARLSLGTYGGRTAVNSMPIINIAWMDRFFWNGRAFSAVDQAFQPVVNHVEMDLTWPEAVDKLMNDDEYVALFKKVFGTEVIDSVKVSEAIVQYELTLVSANSKFDKWLRGEAVLTNQELHGSEIVFNTEIGDCFHCHGGILTTDNIFHNNGLDEEGSIDEGLYKVTGLDQDYGKFKTPTLRNLAFTAPYMHDGRFKTLDEVIDFYSTGVHLTSTTDVLMKKALPGGGGVNLSDFDKAALKAFLLTMTDSTILTNPDFSEPED